MQQAITPKSQMQQGGATSRPAPQQQARREVKADTIVDVNGTRYIARIPVKYEEASRGGECGKTFKSDPMNPVWNIFAGTFEIQLCPSCARKRGLTNSTAK